jgi:hypothetical protein
MTKSQLVLCLMLAGVTLFSEAADDDGFPPVPEGIVIELEGEWTAAQAESLRLDYIKANSDRDQDTAKKYKQQIWRMLHMDDDTRDVALRSGISQRPLRPEYEEPFLMAVSEYYSKCELAERYFKATGSVPLDVTAEKPRMALRTRSLEFTLFYLLVLKPRKIPMDMPEDVIWKLDEGQKDQSKSKKFVEDCYEFFLKHATTRRVREHVSYCMAMTPVAENALHVLSEATKAEGILKNVFYQNDVEYLEGCSQASVVISQCKTLNKRDIVKSLLINAGPAKQVLNKLNLTYRLAYMDENDKALLREVIEGLKKIDKRSAAQDEAIKELTDRLEGRTIQLICNPQDITIKNSYFGF